MGYVKVVVLLVESATRFPSLHTHTPLLLIPFSFLYGTSQYFTHLFIHCLLHWRLPRVRGFSHPC